MSTYPRIVLAVPEDVRTFVFPSAVQERLAALGDLEILSEPDDWQHPTSGAALRTAEVIVTGWRTGRLGEPELDLAPRLQAIIHSAGSMRFLVAESVFSRGVRLSSQAATNARPVAEYTLGTILLALKEAWRASNLYRAARKKLDRQQVMPTAGIADKRVGIVGASTIGRLVIELLRPFDVEVAVFDPYLSTEEAAHLEVTPLGTLDELMGTSDVVSVHAPLLSSTRGMISAAHLAQLGDGATLINTARGALVDQAALIAELQSGRIHAVIDVIDSTVPPEDPLWTLPNAFLTPHIAGAVGTELPRLGHGAVDELERLVHGYDLQYEITAASFARLA